jgi:hypothetical protein
MKADIDVLSDLSAKIGTVGATGAVVQALGPYANALGIKIDGLPDIEAFSSVISRVAPTMRPPGSGATSDFEFKQFLNALPKLSQTTEGRQAIINQLGALADYNIAVGQISEASLAGEMDRQEARKRVEALGNPMNLWRKNNPASDSNRSGAGRFSPQAPIAAPPSAGPPAEAVEMLRQNPTPQTMAQFDEIFGAGASSRVLGSR